MAEQRTRRKRRSAPVARAQRRGLSTRWTWTIVLGVVAVFAAFATQPLWTGGTNGSAGNVRFGDPAVIARGEAVFAQYCAKCHGARAEGQMPGQPNGGQLADGTYLAPALNGTGHAWHHPPDMLFRVVKQGSPAPDSPMKGWGGRLGDDDIHAAIAYFQSLWPEPVKARYRQMLAQRR